MLITKTQLLETSDKNESLAAIMKVVNPESNPMSEPKKEFDEFLSINLKVVMLRTNKEINEMLEPRYRRRVEMEGVNSKSITTISELVIRVEVDQRK
ncbi:MAG: hypothetical protein BalsKO_01400 [Balneolaceae bacterium]